MKPKFALVQYSLGRNFSANYQSVFGLLQRVCRHKPAAAVLPEMWLGGPVRPADRKSWAAFYARAFADLKIWCRINSIACFGSQLAKQGSQYYNAAFYIDRMGHQRGHYNKIHLFKLAGENKLYASGKKLGVFKAPFGRIGIMVCYDLRFPELARKLVACDIQVLIVCAQWPESRSEHWLTLLRARAIENQIFVVATNRLGQKGKIAYRGHSVAFDPWGRRLLHLGAAQKMGFVELDFSLLQRIRKYYPFVRDWRLGC